ncbi:hypothetical protein F5I97DRAFT_1808109 [Phlebopus sp. FC_14]|nr:hypothetical protein F5I97DRAFT_1808109 [Phlebopus sp. FC_14]
MATANPPPGIPEASRLSTQAWQNDLLDLFHNAKDRFPDVVWELHPDDDHDGSEDVWGHKAIVYARAPPSFQARYFSFRPAPITSPTPYYPSPSPVPAQSSVSLSLTLEYAHNSRSPSPFRSSSPSLSTTAGALLHIPTTISPALFSNELEYLYTGKGLGEAFEFLFDTSESRDLVDAEENRIHKLRKDLVYMWRSRLYSDVRVSLSGTFSTTNPEHATAVFASHRFILVSRSPYFRAQLLSWAQPKSAPAAAPGEPITLSLPSPPFTPASLHFTLGYIYTGTLVFSHRTYDLDTAFAIMRSATYLSLTGLYDEIQARIVYEMLHGLYHAFLEFDEYERVTGAKWGIGGCRCRQCARRIPRVLEFAISDDVANKFLDRGARRALVGLFGEGWCNGEFASLSQKIRDSIVKGVSKRTTPANVFSLLFAAQHGLRKLDAAIDAWADVSREMILAARKTIDECIVRESESCFEAREWVEVLEGDGVGFEDKERVGWVLEALKRGMGERWAGEVYQTLVSSILLRPHPTDTESTLLPQNSPLRALVEDARLDLLRWIRKRWVGIRQEGGFDALEGWAVKEISQEIEVPLEDLLSPPSHPTHHRATNPHLSRALRPSLIRGGGDADSDSLSVHSLRASVLSRSVPSKGHGHHGREPTSSGASVRSIARSTVTLTPSSPAAPRAAGEGGHRVRERNASTISRMTTSDIRPDSKLTPDSASVVGGVMDKAKGHKKTLSLSSPTNGHSHTRPTLSRIVTSSTSSMRSTSTTGTSTSKHPTPSVRPRLSTATARSSTTSSSYHSTHQSTNHHHHTGNGLSTLRIPSSRPTSSLSSATSESTFRTAQSELTPTPTSAGARSRKTSTGSTVSNVSVRTIGTNGQRPRVSSGASLSSAITTRTTVRRHDRPETNKLSPATGTRRLPSSAAGRTTPHSVVKEKDAKKNVDKGKDNISENGKSKENILNAPPNLENDTNDTIDNQQSQLDTMNNLPSEPVLTRRASTDTITLSAPSKSSPPLPVALAESSLTFLTPLGASLEIGIPCIISSKRKRFRAFARYIGEVAGERGPWVGVEVPMTGVGGESAWVGDASDGRAWCDGSWGGIRYFDIGGTGSEWEFGERDREDAGRTARRARVDGPGSMPSKGGPGTYGRLKREGDQLVVDTDRSKRLRSVSPATSDMSTSESRGLFVRPQQVLYVVDAVGADL